MNQAEEIKSKLDIVEVIREYITVKTVGANFQALCPFHNEKSPSFVISPEKQIWHCFGCGRGGDVFSFIMEKEGLGFMETLRLLAPKAGVILQYENQQDYSERNRILDILELAGKYYAHILTTPTGLVAREYLLKRGLSDENISDWHLGYSLDSWSGLYDFLKARPLTGKKYTDEEIFLAGLTIKKEPVAASAGRRSGYYDRFRDRIMFPIFDVNDNLIAFTARVNPNKEKTEKMGKYINSPQTKVYDKSRVLFALNKAKSAIRADDLAIVVEGQMDAISCHNHGFKNVVASSGTALTSEQVALIKRFTPNVALLFDMDAAGQMAADRGIKEALAQEMNLKIIVLSSGKDPDECLKNNPEEFKTAVASAKPMLEYYFEKVSAGLDLNILDNKRAVSLKMFAMIDLVVSKMEQGHWLKKISEELGFSETDTREEFVKWQSKHGVLKAGGVRNTKPDKNEAKKEFLAPEMSRDDKLVELLMSLLIKFPEFISYSVDNLDPDILNNEALAKFYRDLIIYYNKSASLNYESFRAYLTEDGGGSEKTLDKLVLLGEKDFYDYGVESVKAEIINIIVELKKYSRQRQVHSLQREIAAAESAGDNERLNVLMDELRKITAS
ncbi:MAG: DNA primase [Candidatus Falkowbacteria bacterium]|nr:DNA primase [Candidatus Falkowbacteria bacterium]